MIALPCRIITDSSIDFQAAITVLAPMLKNCGTNKLCCGRFLLLSRVDLYCLSNDIQNYREKSNILDLEVLESHQDPWSFELVCWLAVVFCWIVCWKLGLNNWHQSPTKSIPLCILHALESWRILDNNSQSSLRVSTILYPFM